MTLETWAARLFGAESGVVRMLADRRLDAAKRDVARAEAAAAEVQAIVQEELRQRHRVWLERCRQAAALYGPLMLLSQEILGAQFPLPGTVRRSLTALESEALHWLKGASE